MMALPEEEVDQLEERVDNTIETVITTGDDIPLLTIVEMPPDTVPTNEIIDEEELDDLITTTRQVLEGDDSRVRKKRNLDEDLEDAPTVAVQLKNEAACNLQKEADKMIAHVTPVKIGDNVLLNVSSFDRGRADPPRIIAVVVEEKEGKLRVATKQGYLSQWLERNSVEATAHVSLRVGDVGTGTEYSLRELVL